MRCLFLRACCEIRASFFLATTLLGSFFFLIAVILCASSAFVGVGITVDCGFGITVDIFYLKDDMSVTLQLIS